MIEVSKQQTPCWQSNKVSVQANACSVNTHPSLGGTATWWYSNLKHQQRRCQGSCMMPQREGRKHASMQHCQPQANATEAAATICMHRSNLHAAWLGEHVVTTPCCRPEGAWCGRAAGNTRAPSGTCRTAVFQLLQADCLARLCCY